MRKMYYLCTRFSSEVARLRISPCEINRLALPPLRQNHRDDFVGSQ